MERTIYYSDGTISDKFYHDKAFHREDGPAAIWHDKNGRVKEEHWWLNNKRHRLDGPAVIVWSERGQIKKIKLHWYVEDTRLTEKKWKAHPLVIEYRLNKLINKELV